MHVALLTLTLASVGPIAPDAPRVPPAGEGSSAKKPTVHARSTAWQLFAGSDKGPCTRVIATNGELAAYMGKPVTKEKEALDLAARTFKVKSIDLTRHMIIVLVGKEQPTSGFTVEVTRWARKGDSLAVAWKVAAPAPGSVVLDVLTTPGVALLIDRVPGKVTFDPSTRAKK